MTNNPKDDKHEEEEENDDDSIMNIIAERYATEKKGDDNFTVGVGAAPLVCAVKDVEFGQRLHQSRENDVSARFIANSFNTKNPQEDEAAAGSPMGGNAIEEASSYSDTRPYNNATTTNGNNGNTTLHYAPPTLTPSCPILLPGAYSYDAGGEMRRVSSEGGPPASIGTSSSSSSYTSLLIDEESQHRRPSEATTSDTGLVVANPIQDEEDLNRQIATPTTRKRPALYEGDQVTASAARMDQQRKERWCILSSGTLLFLLIVGVVLVVVFLLQGATTTNDDDDDRHSTTNYPTGQDNINSTFRPDRPRLSWSEQILTILPNYTTATIVQDMEELTPQSRAFQWLLDDPNLGNYSYERILQRFSLATLFYSTTPEPQKSIGYDGRGWKNDTGWLQYNIHECDWIFFKIAAWRNTGMQYNANLKGPCWESDADDAVQGEAYRHLMLPNNRLEGTIPEEMYLLTSLRSIVFGSNQLHGTLSTRIGDLSTNLEYFSVSGNQHLSGTFPSEFGMLSKLRYAHLFSNQFTGSLPSQMALLTNLEIFGLFLTSITGTIPERFAPPKMKNLYLSFNQLSGTIPTTMLGSMTKLERLALRGNELTGTLPKEIGHLTNCWQLNLDLNGFRGEIPDQLGDLVINGSLLHVNLTRNSFVGTVPSGLCLLGTPAYQNRTPPPNAVIPSPAHIEHDCNRQLCGCDCGC